MLSRSTLFRVNDILLRISKSQEISLQERLFVEKIADNDQSISSLLKKARREQQHIKTSDGIDKLLNDLALGACDPESNQPKGADDLGDWFKGAPSWLSRS